MDFHQMNINARLDRGEIAQLCELYVAGIPMTKLSVMFNTRNDKIYQYLSIHYFGTVPKAFQKTVVIQSKINGEPP